MKFWQDRSTLVTGSTGLLGSWLIPALLGEGARVVALVRQPAPHRRWWERVTPVIGDLRDAPLVARALYEHRIDTVFHLAALTLVGEASARPAETFDINVRGTWQLLEAARCCPSVRQLVCASTDKAYGDHAEPPSHEEMPLRGRYPYEASKACADLIARGYAASYGMRIAVTRCANFYGGGDLNWSRIVPGTIRAALAGQAPIIRSDGRSVRDYLYIEDAVAACLTLAEALASRDELVGQAFNFGHGVPVSVAELVQRVLNLCGRADLRPNVRAEASREIREQYVDASRARALLGWVPGYSLTEGLLKTIGWYRAYLGAGAVDLHRPVVSAV